MHGNVPVRFGRGRLDSLGNKGLAAYLIPGVGAPLIPRGGRQGIGHQLYFPSRLLTTAQPVGYRKRVTDWLCDSR